MPLALTPINTWKPCLWTNVIIFICTAKLLCVWPLHIIFVTCDMPYDINIKLYSVYEFNGAPWILPYCRWCKETDYRSARASIMFQSYIFYSRTGKNYCDRLVAFKVLKYMTKYQVIIYIYRVCVINMQTSETHAGPKLLSTESLLVASADHAWNKNSIIFVINTPSTPYTWIQELFVEVISNYNQIISHLVYIRRSNWYRFWNFNCDI